MPSTEMILTILVTVIAVLGLVQLIVFIAILLALKKGVTFATEYATEMKGQVIPVLEHSKALLNSSKELITRLQPKLEAAVADLAEITHIASAEARRIQASTDEITDRISRQAARVDGMTTDVLNGVDRVGHMVNQAVTIPVRQVSGVVAAAKAIFDTLRAPVPHRDGQHGRGGRG